MFNAMTLIDMPSFRALTISSMTGVNILLTVHYLIEMEWSPITVWYIWSLYFLILIVTASAIPLFVGWKYKMMNKHFKQRIVIAVLMMAIGGGWTQIIHIVCDEELKIDYFFPFHSLWHFFAAIASYLVMTLLDEVNVAVQRGCYKKSDRLHVSTLYHSDSASN